MGLLDRFERRPSVKSSLFRLTEQGKEKLQTFSGDTTSRILMALETDGSLKLSELSSKTGVSGSKLEHLLPLLTRQGLIAIAGEGEAL